jgi:REP element-mobilizing transposase RayT
MPRHTTASDLSIFLPGWMADICLAFGWRLENFSLLGEAISWVVSVPPVTAPSAHVKTIRQQLSRLIFEEFPSLARENPSGDFWAPGFMLTSLPQPHTPQAVQDFLQDTRRAQGAGPVALGTGV